MRVRSAISFTGVISMRKDEERDVTDKKVLNDLLKCGYVVEVKEKKTRKGVKKDETK